MKTLKLDSLSEIFDRILALRSHNDDSCFLTAEGQNIFTVEYPGIILTVLGECTDEHQKWSGVLTRAEISYSNFEMGSGLSPECTLTNCIFDILRTGK